MDVRYEIPDFNIPNQELTKEDIKHLLSKEVITVFSLVRRTTEQVAMPLVSHPDFESDWREQTLTSPSKKFVAFIEKLEEMKNTSLSSGKVSTSSIDDPNPLERRKEEVNVFLSQGTKTFTGVLMDRTDKSLRVGTNTVGVKVGQPVDLLIVNKNTKEKQRGLVKSFTERADRRKKGSLFYIYEISLTGVFLR